MVTYINFEKLNVPIALLYLILQFKTFGIHTLLKSIAFSKIQRRYKFHIVF